MIRLINSGYFKIQLSDRGRSMSSQCTHAHPLHFLSFILDCYIVGLFLQILNICHRECSIITITV